MISVLVRFVAAERVEEAGALRMDEVLTVRECTTCMEGKARRMARRDAIW